jgi:hypothetical protein
MGILRCTCPILTNFNLILFFKYLRELENHTNALAVNLLDNSETTQKNTPSYLYQTDLSKTHYKH